MIAISGTMNTVLKYAGGAAAVGVGSGLVLSKLRTADALKGAGEKISLVGTGAAIVAGLAGGIGGFYLLGKAPAAGMKTNLGAILGVAAIVIGSVAGVIISNKRFASRVTGTVPADAPTGSTTPGAGTPAPATSTTIKPTTQTTVKPSTATATTTTVKAGG